MGFGSDLEFQESWVNAGEFFVSFQSMEEGRHLGRSWEILRLWEITAKIILGAVELRGLNNLLKIKAETPEKCTVSVLQVHEDPRRDYEWPDRPPRAP